MINELISNFFGTMRHFFEIFWMAPKGPPFYIFRLCNTVQKAHFFKSPRAPLQFFFHTLQPDGVSQSPKVPLLQV